MSLWSEIRPPTPDHTGDGNDLSPRVGTLVKAAKWLPLALALLAALLGLAVVAHQQSTSEQPLIVESADLPTNSSVQLIDVNTATVAELATLPGIGKTRAKAMIALRERARFTSLADLVDRGVLRPSQLTAIAEQATVYVTFD